MQYSREGGENRSPITALQAFQFVQPVSCKLDRQYQLRMIVSQNRITANGTSAHWEFFFNLLRRRAKIACEWVLPWNETIDDYGQTKMDITVTPFPAVQSTIRTVVREGKLLHQQMIGMWRQECKRSPTLPTPFRDTDSVMADFVQQGLGSAAGKPFCQPVAGLSVCGLNSQGFTKIIKAGELSLLRGPGRRYGYTSVRQWRKFRQVLR